MGHPPRRRALSARAGRALSEPLGIPVGLDASIAFLRHGESVLIAAGRFQGQADSPLSPLGERQADLAAARLARPTRSPLLAVPDRPPVEIVHSPLARTSGTAHRVAAAIGDRWRDDGDVADPVLRPDAGFLEIGQGAWEGLRREEIEGRYGEILAAWRRDPLSANAPGGERVVDVAVRVREGLGRLLERLASQPAAARPHASAAGYPPPASPDTPWSLLVGHDGVFKVALLLLLGMPLERFWTFPFALCGISIVELRGGSPVLRAHNLTEHLAPLLDERAIAESEERQRTGAL